MSARRFRPRTTGQRQAALDSARPGTFTDGVRLSAGTLTALPVPAPVSIQAPAPGIAMALAPVAGLIPGLAAWVAVSAAGLLGLSPLAAAALAIGSLALATRGLHLDGLADTADGLAASYERQRALDVMRKGDTGPAGMATVVIVLLVQAAALAQALPAAGWGLRGQPGWIGDTIASSSVVLIAAVAARVAVPLACTRGIRPARPEGLGATVAGSVTVPALIVVVAVTALLCSLLALASDRPWASGLVAVLAVIGVTGLVVRRAVARFGGITGDVIGAGLEAGTMTALLVLAAWR